MDNTFLDWLNDQMKAKGWKAADLSHASKLDSAVISNILNGKRRPGIKTSTAIAYALRISPEIVLQAAGLLHHRVPSRDDAIISEINEIYERLTPPNQVEALEYFRMKARLQDERENETASRNVHTPDDKK
jgi:transcriptional regulator with XRE-family HTH domain